MTQVRHDIPQPLRGKLVRLRRALRVWLWIDGLARLALWTAGIVLVDFGVDRLFRMDRAQRAILWGVMLATLGAVAWRRLVRPLSRAVSDDALAARVEQQHRDLQQQVISALQFARMDDPASRGASGQLVRATIDRGGQAAERVPFDDVLNRRRRNRNLARGIAAVGFLAVLFIAFPSTMGLWWQRNILIGDARWPQKTKLSIVGAPDGALIVPRGDDVTLVVRADGVAPDEVTLEHRPAAGGRRVSEPMAKFGRDTYRLKLRNVLEPRRLRAHGGDGSTDWIVMRLVERPDVAQLTLQVTPPNYISDSPHTLPPGQGSYYVPAGSTLAIAGRANKNLSAARLLLGHEAIGPLTRPASDRRAFRAVIGPDALRSGTYGIDLVDTTRPTGLASRRPVRFSIRVVEDQTPTVRARLSGIGDMIVPRAVVPIDCRFTDDHAITDAALAWRQPSVESDAAREGRLPFDALAGRFGAERIGPYAYRLAVEPLELAVGRHLTFHVEATDNDTVTGPKTGRSTLFSLKVVTEEELRGELLRREQEQRMEFERLLADQQALLVATRALAASVRGADEIDVDARRALVATERKQRLAAGRCESIAGQFEQILAEVANNRLEASDGPIHRRLRSRILQPLGALADRDIPAAANGLGAVGGLADAPADRHATLEATLKRQRAIVAAMQRILAAMVKLEGYQEAINLLREIVKEQKQVRRETLEALERRIREIFDE